MYVVFSLVLMALGAILRWGVVDSVSGVNLDRVGMILLLTGLAGLLISGFYEMSRRNRTIDREVTHGPHGSSERVTDRGGI